MLQNQYYKMLLIYVLFYVFAFPVPTPDHVRWQRDEIVALIHFNMGSFLPNGTTCRYFNWDQAKHPSTFYPAKLDVQNWIESFKALGAKSAVLTAEHGCGFLLWPTKTLLPDGRPYGYSVEYSIKRDIAREFAEACEQNDIGHGFYYNIENNYYLCWTAGRRDPKCSNGTDPELDNRHNLTEWQFYNLAYEQLTELWSNYGNFTELWFDGGYGGLNQSNLVNLLHTMQPHAVGGGVDVARSPNRWIRTESGYPVKYNSSYPEPVWSTSFKDVTGLGDPDAPIWMPPFADTTLTDPKKWFFAPGETIRNLSQLIEVYHNSVGSNSVLELDFAINRDGLVEPSHAEMYKQLGNWIRACYGAPVVATALLNNGVALLRLPTGVVVDRLWVREDIVFGERVRVWRIEEKVENNWIVRTVGQVIGNKQILVYEHPFGIAALVRLVIVKSIAEAKLLHFAAFERC